MLKNQMRNQMMTSYVRSHHWDKKRNPKKQIHQNFKIMRNKLSVLNFNSKMILIFLIDMEKEKKLEMQINS